MPAGFFPTQFGSGFVPTNIPGCILWLRADLGITLLTGAVSQWNDQSSTGAVLTSSAGPPGWTASNASYNHQATADFSNSHDLISSGTVTIPNVNTTIFVANADGTATSQFYMEGNSGWGFSNGANTSHIEMFGSSSNLIATLPNGLTTATPVVYAGVWAATSNVYGDNSQTSLGSNAIGNGGSASTITIGSNSGSTFLLGSIAEVIVYNFALTNAQLLQVFQYLGQRYNIAIS